MTGQDAAAAQEDSADLESLINGFLDENPRIVADYRKNDKAANQVIGFVMRQTGGRYSSAEVVETAKKLIEARF
jgi:aspartyl-tRNA(Asn)/glutamyl-tRNA(Gln) amidotransferase subunit B